MNNSDFLSDAVALDLGKSGVKVAETLEIEVGEEWWRLINAADVSTVRAYQSRRFQDPVISDGELHLDGFTKTDYTVAQELPTTTGGALNLQHYPGVAFYTAAGEYRYAVGWMSSYSDTASYFALSAYDVSGTVVSSVIVSGRALTTDPGYVPVAVIVDTVNNRVLALSAATADNGSTFSTTKYQFMLDMGDGTGNHNSTSADMILRHCRTFAEAPGAGYSLLTGATLAVKKHSFVLGETWTAAIHDLNSIADSIAITGAANFRDTPKLFYSRWHESVAAIWYDSVAQTPYYVLESEGWNTLHALPDFCNGGEWTLENFGNLAIPENGEFLIGALKKTPGGNVTRPSGWSYPVNFNLLSAFDLGGDAGVIWGNVGTTLYRLNVTLSTMTITTVETAALTVLPGAGTYVHLLAVGDDGDKELYTITDIYSGSTSNRLQYGIFVWKRSTGSILFEFGGADRANATYFPVTYNRDSPWNFVVRMLSPSHLLMLRLYSNTATSYSHNQDYYALETSDVFACDSRAEFLDLLLATGVVSKSLSLYNRVSPSVSSRGPAFDPSVCIHDEAYYYIPTIARQSAGSLTMRFRRDTLDMDMVYWGGSMRFLFAADYVRHGVQSYSAANPYVSETSLAYIDAVNDGYIYSYSTTSGNSVYSVSGTLAGLTQDSRQKINISPYTLLNDTYPLSLPTGANRTRLYVPMFGTNAYIWGVCHDGTLAGNAGRVVPLGHTHARSFRKIGAADTEVYSISAVTGGEIRYACLNGYEGGDLGKIVALSNTGEIYDVTGLEGRGGLLSMNFSGRGIHAVTGHAKHLWLDTAAELTEGMGDGYSGGGGGSGGFTGYIYTYQDSEFTPYPFAREGIRAELSNISKTTKITLPETQDNLIRGMLAAGTDFRGSRCILRRVFPDHLDEAGSDIVLLDGYIQDWSYVPGKKGIAFSVSKTLIDVGAQFPKRLMNMGCSHVFKGSRCQYLGEEGRCLKTRAFCTSLGNLNQFGGFPWVAARQRRVMWK